MADYSFISNAHPSYIDAMYQRYLADPGGVEEDWRLFFKGFDYAAGSNGAVHGSGNAVDEAHLLKEFRVLAVIVAYRNRGHLRSTTNPIRERRDRRPNLDLSDFELSEADLDTRFRVSHEVGLENASLRDIIAQLEKAYCSNIGFEFHHISSRERRRWIRTRIEAHDPDTYDLTPEKKRRILEKLNGAVGFEHFLHTKYVGQKRFSLEGGETTIPALDAIINKGVSMGVEEVVIGMAHRGRLNVLANILGKTYANIFNEFEGTTEPDLSFGDGDVKYHLGMSSLIETPDGGKVHLKLVPNPSHLESVNPVVQGFARAKTDILYGENANKILPILIHGDAALAGQGIVYETVQMSMLKGYHVGGTVHFVINNQVGFTTDFDDGRSSTYCTSVASMVDAPVFHVNGDDPEAVVFACEMAIEYRQTFHTDVFIDMVCYRRHGHNEGDDPEFTQPQMYNLIKDHPNPRELYRQILIERGYLDGELADKLEKDFWENLQDRLDEVRQKSLPYEYQEPEEAWRSMQKLTTAEDYDQSPVTGIETETLEKLIEHLMSVPEGFAQLRKFNRLLKGRKKQLEADELDWAMGELLAYSSILAEGRDVRMSGQDVRRGTFSHRHAIMYDDVTYEEYNRLSNIQEGQGKFRIFNSLLSEFGVLGFEYGYSLASPETLVLWEAQFGDFYNGAQTIVDQYITAAESKWQRMSGLVMLLPHGYEGQGPEHSSARLERFLQACARHNITVANCTTPANLFHLLRRQLARPFRKPLVLMTPKSGLRHPEVVSPRKDFVLGTRFQEIIDDASIGSRSNKKVKRLLLCSGKVYFDLLKKQRDESRSDVAIVRVEQLYPLPEKQLEATFAKYSEAEIYWVQEESENMGAWQYILGNYYGKKTIQLISRKASASPATGYMKVHLNQQAEIVEKAFSL